MPTANQCSSALVKAGCRGASVRRGCLGAPSARLLSFNHALLPPPYTLHPLTLPSSAQAWLRERPSLHDPPIPPLPPRTRVGAYGRLGLAELFEMREECLREFGFNDVYRQAGTGGGRGGSERLEAAAVAIAQAQLVVMSSGPGPTCHRNASTLTLQVNLTTNHVFFPPLPPLQAG